MASPVIWERVKRRQNQENKMAMKHIAWYLNNSYHYGVVPGYVQELLLSSVPFSVKAVTRQPLQAI